MRNILILTARPEYWSEHSYAMRERGFETCFADSVKNAEKKMREMKTALALVDLPHNYTSSGFTLRELLELDPNLNIAVVSHFGEEDFKKSTADLEVLRLLPLKPTPLDIDVLLNKLEWALGLR